MWFCHKAKVLAYSQKAIRPIILHKIYKSHGKNFKTYFKYDQHQTSLVMAKFNNRHCYFARSNSHEVLWYVRLCVCVSARIYLEPHTRSLPNFCMLLMAVTRSSSGVVAIRYVLSVLWLTSCFSIMGHMAVWISLRKTHFAYIYLFTVKTDRIQFLIIKGHNFDQVFRNYLQTKVKEEQINLTINGKNYRNARHVAIVTMVTVNIGGETNTPLTLMHERRKAKLI